MNNRKLHIAFAPSYSHPLPEGHRFPMLKYELIPAQLMYEGVIEGSNIFEPGVCADETVLLAHAETYLQKLKWQTLTPSEQRRIGFPQSPGLTQRELIITQGTVDCCLHALENGVALNIAGGTHHAFADHGEGFCLLNDFGVAGHYLLHKKIVERILIIDLDVHQGNGTAKIFEADPRVFTFSMHGRNNYPFHKEKSDLDIELEDGIGDEAYLGLLNGHLPRVIEQHRPDIAFFVSGVDILYTDKFGKLKVSLHGCRLRDETVFTLLKEKGIPCAVAMGGGYSPDVKIIVEAHCNTYRAAKDIYGLN